MLKILVVIVVLSLLFIWIKADRKTKIMKNNRDENPDNNDDKKKNQIPKSDMIECSKCSTYIPISDAVMSNGKYSCPNNCE